jgi:endonuclease/exonuclease/phosphatase family metal-dependent hydrolase
VAAPPSSPPEAPASPASIRVVTFNIERGERIEQAITALTTHPDLRNADVVLLQEMSGAGVEAIASRLGMAAVYYPASNRGGRDSGNAVLSRWPIESSWKVPLPHVSRTWHEARAAVGTRLLVGGRLMRVYSAHISSPFGLGPGQRRDQVEVLLADAEPSPEPVLIGGDFNGYGIGKLLVERGYTWLTREAGPSMMSFSIDHVFVRGLPDATGRSGVAQDVRDASDHRPVWAVIDLNP